MTLIRQAGSRFGLALLALLIGASLALAQSYSLSRSAVTGGGGSLQTTGGNYTLTGSIAQAGAGPVVSDGGSYTLNGDFWPADSSTGAPPLQKVYLPVILRNP